MGVRRVRRLWEDQSGAVLRGWFAVVVFVFLVLYTFFAWIQGNRAALNEGLSWLLGSIIATAVLYAVAALFNGLGAAGKRIIDSASGDKNDDQQNRPS